MLLLVADRKRDERDLDWELNLNPGPDLGWNLDLTIEGKESRIVEKGAVRCRILRIFSGQHLT